VTQPLSPLDATFLELEEADPAAHMHIGALMVFDPMPGGGPPDVDMLREQLSRRLGAVPRYRERLSSRHTGGLSWPHWEPDERFDLSVHIRRAALPAPGGEAELLEWAGDFYSIRLDRSRPLWETTVLEGLAEGRWALATKSHHCMVDGVSSVDVGQLLLDTTAEPANWSAPLPLDEPGEPETAPALRLVSAPLRAVRAGADLALHPHRAKEALDSARALVELLVRDELLAAPRTSLNVPLGEHRRLAAHTVALDDLRRVRAARGGSINDVVLALVTAGLRRLLVARGEEPPEAGLRAMVPVNIRAAGDELSLGNQVSSLFVHLPVSRADPSDRYDAVRDETQRLKGGHEAAAGQTLVELTGLAPPIVHSFAARSAFGTRMFNVTVTNVPGPQLPLYAFGARLRRIIPLVPLAAEHALAVAAVSYDGDLCLCVNADRDAVPDLEEVVVGMGEELDALLEGVGPGAQRHPTS
jgi:WS/DGAT/MGAT family acyltransferase